MSTKQNTIAVVDLGSTSHVNESSTEMFPFRRIGCQTLLERTVRRLSDCLRLDAIAITGAPEFSSHIQRGHLQPAQWLPNPNSVSLARVADSAKQLDAELVVLVSPACPFIDPILVDRLITAAWGSPEADFVAFASQMRPTFSLDDLGLVAEVVHRRVLKRLVKDHRFSDDPRRIPQLVRSMPEVFQARLLPLPSSIDRDDLRFVLENDDDWERAYQLVEASGNDYDYRDLAFLAGNIDTRLKAC